MNQLTKCSSVCDHFKVWHTERIFLFSILMKLLDANSQIQALKLYFQRLQIILCSSYQVLLLITVSCTASLLALIICAFYSIMLSIEYHPASYVHYV
jgi:hypothetical protein